MPSRDLPERFEAFVSEHRLLEEGQRVIVGVSGGIDSVVLLHLLRKRYDPIAAHIHHGLREDADLDADFVSHLARAWEIEHRVIRVDVESGASVQGKARAARYDALQDIAESLKIERVAVAHQRDDVAETLLLHLFRGAGPGGWAALPVSRPISRDSTITLIRPLRFASRREILDYARMHDLTWREDPSNENLGFRRIFVRNRVMPLLQEGFGEGVAERIAQSAELAELYREAGIPLDAEDRLQEASVEKGTLSIAVLASLPPIQQTGVILAFLTREAPEVIRSAAVAEEVAALISRQPGRRVELGEYVIWREPDVLRLTLAEPPPIEFSAAVASPGITRTPYGDLFMDHVESPHTEEIGGDPLIEFADADKIDGKLLLRTWRAGDHMTPLGMTGKKNVSDLLSEKRIPHNKRGEQLVLLADSRILWLLGHRIAESIRITSDSSRFTRMMWVPKSLPDPYLY